MPKVGDPAPKFHLQSGTADYVALEDFLGSKNVVIYFYPKDRSTGCTREARSFRDDYSAFKELDAEILGISKDSTSSHAEFAKEERLPFPLLSDPDGSVIRSYGVKPTLGIIAGRTTFIVDKNSIIRHIFTSQIRPEKHVAEALDALRFIVSSSVSVK